MMVKKIFGFAFIVLFVFSLTLISSQAERITSEGYFEYSYIHTPDGKVYLTKENETPQTTLFYRGEYRSAEYLGTLPDSNTSELFNALTLCAIETVHFARNALDRLSFTYWDARMAGVLDKYFSVHIQTDNIGVVHLQYENGEYSVETYDNTPLWHANYEHGYIVYDGGGIRESGQILIPGGDPENPTVGEKIKDELILIHKLVSAAKLEVYRINADIQDGGGVWAFLKWDDPEYSHLNEAWMSMVRLTNGLFVGYREIEAADDASEVPAHRRLFLTNGDYYIIPGADPEDPYRLYTDAEVVAMEEAYQASLNGENPPTSDNSYALPVLCAVASVLLAATLLKKKKA